MSHLANLAAVVGLLLPLLIAVVQQQHWRQDIRAAVGFVICFVAAFVTAWVEGKLTAKDLLSSFLVCYTLAQTSYHALWTKIGITQAIETATSRPPGDARLAHDVAVNAPNETEQAATPPLPSSAPRARRRKR
jgi:hypothetical protein